MYCGNGLASLPLFLVLNVCSAARGVVRHVDGVISARQLVGDPWHVVVLRLAYDDYLASIKCRARNGDWSRLGGGEVGLFVPIVVVVVEYRDDSLAGRCLLPKKKTCSIADREVELFDAWEGVLEDNDDEDDERDGKGNDADCPRFQHCPWGEHGGGAVQSSSEIRPGLVLSYGPRRRNGGVFEQEDSLGNCHWCLCTA